MRFIQILARILILTGLALFAWKEINGEEIDPRSEAFRGTYTRQSGNGTVILYPDLSDPSALYRDWRTLRVQRLAELTAILAAKIHFDFDSAELDRESLPVAKQLAEVLKNNPDVGLRVAGHTDKVGSNDYNDDLSVERAFTLVRFFINQGISRDRFFTYAHGEAKPAVETEDRERANRRVEISLVDLFKVER